jgi:hypothetical protein
VEDWYCDQPRPHTAVLSPSFYLCAVLYESDNQADGGLTFVQTLRRMRTVLRKGGYSQIPQLSSSRRMDVSQSFYIAPPDCPGTRRAVLIGINYEGQNGELSGCHNDCLNMKDYIIDTCGFEEENVLVLMDDGQHDAPTRTNILGAYRAVAAMSASGDAVFCHYSGKLKMGMFPGILCIRTTASTYNFRSFYKTYTLSTNFAPRRARRKNPR